MLDWLARASVPTSCVWVEVTETLSLGRGAGLVERALNMLIAGLLLAAYLPLLALGR